MQFLYKVSRIEPAVLDLYEKLEKNFGSYHLLDVEAGRGSNLLEHLAAFAKQDFLLPVALAKNHTRNSRPPPTFFQPLDTDRNPMRHFLLRPTNNVLPDSTPC